MKKIQMIRNEKETITLQQAFEGFTRKCQLRNLSKETIAYYKESFKYLNKVISSEDKVCLLSESSIESLVMLLRRSMEDTSINTRLSNI